MACNLVSNENTFSTYIQQKVLFGRKIKWKIWWKSKQFTKSQWKRHRENGDDFASLWGGEENQRWKPEIGSFCVLSFEVYYFFRLFVADNGEDSLVDEYKNKIKTIIFLSLKVMVASINLEVFSWTVSWQNVRLSNYFDCCFNNGECYP